MDGEVLIVDEHTGRMLAGRRYNDGLHQAIEAKEGVTVREEYQTLATDHPAELLPPLRQALRHDRYGHDRGLASSTRSTSSAWCRSRPTGRCRASTRPTWSTAPRRPSTTPSSTTSPSATRRASRSWSAPCRSRSPSSSRACCASAASRTPSSTPSSTPTRPRSSRSPATRARSPSPPTWPVEAPTSCSAARSTSSPTRSCASRASTRSGRPPRSTTPRGRPWSSGSRPRSPPSTTRSRTLGGLYVVGTERHESRRIDNQLRGRSGRQGDPGESRFYLSLQDEMMRLFKSEWVDRVLHGAQGPRRRADREQARHQRHRQRPGQHRVAELRVAQERPQVRRRDEPPARGHLRRAPPGARGRRPRASRSARSSTTWSPATSPGRPRATPRSWDLDALVDRAQAALPVSVSPRRLENEAGGRAEAEPRDAARRPAEGRPGGLRPPRGRDRRRGDARARASRDPLGAGPQVARAPLRDGLPARGHLPAGLLPARPARGVPARGLRHVRRDDGRHQGGVGRLPLQPPGRGRGGRGARGRGGRRASPRSQEPHARRRPGRRPRAATAATAHAPQIRAKGLEKRTRPTQPDLLRPGRGRRRRGHGARPTRRGPVRRHRPQRVCPCGSGKKFKQCHGAPGGASGYTARVSG